MATVFRSSLQPRACGVCHGRAYELALAWFGPSPPWLRPRDHAAGLGRATELRLTGFGPPPPWPCPRARARLLAGSGRTRDSEVGKLVSLLFHSLSLLPFTLFRHFFARGSHLLCMDQLVLCKLIAFLSWWHPRLVGSAGQHAKATSWLCS